MKKLFVFVLVLATLLFVVACSSKKKNDAPDDDNTTVSDEENDEEENDEDNATVPDEDGDSGPVVTPDSDPVVTPDSDPTSDDPCKPNPCTEANRNRCVVNSNGGFTCECNPSTCEIGGVCYAEGERSPQNSCLACERYYSKNDWTQLPDDYECDANGKGIGSGTCRSGQCKGFGTCDNRAYGSKPGMPCNRDVECGTGFCYTWYDWSGDTSGQLGGFVGASVCTGACREDEDCPHNMTCQYFNENYKYQCMPLYVAGVELPSPKQPNFAPCNKNEDCEGGLCLSYGDKEKFCTSECTSSIISNSCGSCGKCYENKSNSNLPGKYCLPKGSGDLGDPCQSSMDCSSGGCYDGYCVKTCGSILSSCGNGYDCGTLPDYFGESEVCYNKNRFNLPDGTHCNYDEQCASGECLVFEDLKICGSHCQQKDQVTDNGDGTSTTTKYYACGDDENSDRCIPVKVTDSSSMNGYSVHYYCTQELMLGRNEFGKNCYADWQCEEGYSCFEGYFCTKMCYNNDDCDIDHTCYILGTEDPEEEGGDPVDVGVCISYEQTHHQPPEACEYVWSCEDICYEDSVIQQYYCTIECSSDADCFDIGGCYNGVCTKAIPYRNDFYAACRFDDDCEKTAICDKGMCTLPCTSASTCPAYDAVAPTGTQKTCKPCETSDDCKTLFYDYGSCVIDYDGNKFCMEDCSENIYVCPEGTRCNGRYCYPLAGSCEGGKAFCDQGSHCAVPTLRDGWLCSENGQCLSNKCGSGFCQKGAGCSSDADCGCDDLTCKSGSCVPKSSKGQLEVEPNDNLTDAQAIDNDKRIFAGFTQTMESADIDIFKLSATAGQYINARTRPFCNDTLATTFISLLDSTGEEIAYNDAAAYAYRVSNWIFAEIVGFEVTESGDYYIAVTQSPYNSNGYYSTPYTVDFYAFDPVGHDTCDNPKPLSTGTTTDSFRYATNAFSASACTMDSGNGPELFYKVTVPAGKLATIKATPAAQTDIALALLTSCAADQCAAGNSFGAFGYTEELVYHNATEADQELILVVEAVINPVGDDFSIEFELGDAPAAPANDTVETATLLEGSGSIQGQTISANADYAPAAGSCENQNYSYIGKDVVYKMEMAAGDYFHAHFESNVYMMGFYIVHEDDLNTCTHGGSVFASANMVNFEIPTDENATETSLKPGTYYLFVDAFDATSSGTFRMTYEKGTSDLAACKGICTSNSSHRVCDDEGANLCLCDQSTYLLYSTDCNAWCSGDDMGALSGVCGTATSGSTTRSGCVCSYDCTDTAKVQEVCAAGSPSNCTCSASDPCHWNNNGTCDSMCASFFPLDHFADNQDCTSSSN